MRPAGFAIVERALRDGAAQHFLQTHGLGAQLKLVRLVRLWPAALVLHGKGQPAALLAREGDALWRGAKFDHVALAGQSQGRGGHRQTAENQSIAPPLPKGGVVGTLMEELALYGAQIFLPLLFQMDQRPLAAAEGKVLKAGEGEELLLTEVHPIRRQVIPAGRAASSTVTE